MKNIKTIFLKDNYLPKNRFRMSKCPPVFSGDNEFLQFQVEYEIENGKYTRITGQISCDFLARWGQIGDEGETEYLLSVYLQGSNVLGQIAAEIFASDPLSFPVTDKGYPLVNITKNELHNRSMYVD